MNKKRVLAICGSTRTNSTNESILNGISIVYSDLDLIFYKGLSNLPHFNPDISDNEVSTEVKEFRSLIENSDGVIICTPEYVFSLPGSLKNALEWTVSTTVFMDKPTALIIASGVGEKTYESLLLIMNTFRAKFGDPGAILIQGARNKFDDKGLPIDQGTKEKISTLMEAFRKLL